VANYLIRLKLPDRPGALGAVASRIGSVGGDVVAIDILQREAGVVVDELGVMLASDDLVELLRGEILEVDGVSVEALRCVDGPLPDRHAELLDTATSLFQQTTPTGVLEYLTAQVRRSLDASYAVTIDPSAPWPVAADGDAPTDEDLRGLARRVLTSTGARSVDDEAEEDDHAAVSRLFRAGVVLIVARPDLVFRARERQRVSTMTELADHRWRELTSRSTAR
jgi:hypothetical protein